MIFSVSSSHQEYQARQASRRQSVRGQREPLVQEPGEIDVLHQCKLLTLPLRELVSPECITDLTNVIGAAYRKIKLKRLGLYE